MPNDFKTSIEFLASVFCRFLMSTVLTTSLLIFLKMDLYVFGIQPYYAQYFKWSSP